RESLDQICGGRVRNQARGDPLKAEAESLFEPDRSEDARGIVQETSCMQHTNGASPQIALPFIGVEHTTELPLVELYRDGIDREVPPGEILFNRRMLNRRQEGWLRVGLSPGRRDINLEAMWKRKPRRFELFIYRQPSPVPVCRQPREGDSISLHS